MADPLAEGPGLKFLFQADHRQPLLRGDALQTLKKLSGSQAVLGPRGAPRKRQRHQPLIALPGVRAEIFGQAFQKVLGTLTTPAAGHAKRFVPAQEIFRVRCSDPLVRRQPLQIIQPRQELSLLDLPDDPGRVAGLLAELLLGLTGDRAEKARLQVLSSHSSLPQEKWRNSAWATP